MPSEKPAKNSIAGGMRQAARSILNKIPLPSKKNLADMLCATMAITGILIMAARLPQMHDKYLRSSVGSKVYKIQAKLDGGGGTGFQVRAPSGTNYVLTNAHVCEAVAHYDAPENAGTALLVNDDGSWIRRRIIAVSDQSDLCLIEGAPGVNGLSLGSEPHMGEELTVVGHPHLRPLTLSAGDLIGSQTIKIPKFIIGVEGLDPFLMTMVEVHPELPCNQPKQEIDIFQEDGVKITACMDVTTDAYLTSAVIYPGNSGSPVVNWYGNVVGVAFATDPSDHYGDVVSLHDIKTFLSHY